MAKVLDFSLEDFGIKADNKIDASKKELIERILSSSEKEINAYSELLNTMSSIVRILK